tara:strand:- start:3173 stop:3385 length:213 start_codon:yes stop_codon:yes gene_type:complete
MIKKGLRMLSNIFKPWSKGQRALWYQQRRQLKQIQSMHAVINEIQLSFEGLNLAEKKPKRGRPRKKSQQP